MHILMMSNTYTPLVGGIEASLDLFHRQLRKMGHKVVIVAPGFKGIPEKEEDVVRIPAISHFLGSDFSLNLPVTGLLSNFIKEFKPDIVHSHHPFLVGDLALRISRQHQIPLVFTHHIMLDQYIDFFKIKGELFKRFVVELSTGYANLADCVIVPSSAAHGLLRKTGVTSPLHIVPTGVDAGYFAQGHGADFRQKWGIPLDAFVVGHLGRLTPEKNPEFLARAAVDFLKTANRACCLIVGTGPSAQTLKTIFQENNLEDRFYGTGLLHERELVDAYHAMDVFMFASHTETQGLVLLESLAAGTPVVALDVPPLREYVQDYRNGRLVPADDREQFAEGLSWFMNLPQDKFREMKRYAQETVGEFTIEKSARKLLDIYTQLIRDYAPDEEKDRIWHVVKNRLGAEKDLLKNLIEAGEVAVKERLMKRDPV